MQQKHPALQDGQDFEAAITLPAAMRHDCGRNKDISLDNTAVRIYQAFASATKLQRRRMKKSSMFNREYLLPDTDVTRLRSPFVV